MAKLESPIPIIVYTDGSSMGNNNSSGKWKGGWAAVILDPVSSDFRRYSGYDPSTTNQRMEIKAVIEALKVVPKNRFIIIYTDSAYVRNCIKDKWYKTWSTNGWKNSKGQDVANQDLWKELLAELEKLESYEFKKVKGHSGDFFNDECDIMAKSIVTFYCNAKKNILESSEKDIQKIFKQKLSSIYGETKA